MNCNAEMNAFQPKLLNRIADKVIERNQPKSLNSEQDFGGVHLCNCEVLFSLLSLGLCYLDTVVL